MTSPAERFQAAAERARHHHVAAFELTYEFPFDDFQVQACRAVEDGQGVLVAAPTGSGKTVVGEFAVFLSLATGKKAFYTTPIKALSNQKYIDLVARHGRERVGLLTGDQSINGEADIVVMTTEVLRNMLYAGSTTLHGLGFVVMDEVHYLADRFRGPVWEEVIIHLAEDVQVVSLSATVSNAEEFGDWLAEVRGDTAVVVSEHRPVPLWQHVMVGREIFDLYSEGNARGRLNPELVDVVRQVSRSERSFPSGGRNGRGGKGRRPVSRQGGGRGKPGHGSARSKASPSRVAVVNRLASHSLLPAIFFIFSRAGCDSAVEQCLLSGLGLTSERERSQIRAIVEERCAEIPREDLSVLGYWTWLEALELGFGAHHAGLLPVFKETVEVLFSAGLVKVVFATETLALGINMPARTVVLEKLVKWDGSGHHDLTPGEYTQLTGRAGRRGIDVEGHAVVVYHSGLEPEALSGLASKRTYPLRSSFKPTYNMAVNLVASAGRLHAREILEMSFAQFQADRGVVGLARQVRAHEEALAGYAESMVCERGDFAEFLALRQAVSDREGVVAKARSKRRQVEIAESFEGVGRGDVVEVVAGKRGGFGVVVDSGAVGEFGGPRPTVLMEDRQVRVLSADDVKAPLRVVGTIAVDSSVRTAAERRDASLAVRSFLDSDVGGVAVRPQTMVDEELDELRAQVRSHPCDGCPDRDAHARWGYRWTALKKDHDGLLRRIEGRTSSIARIFDRIVKLLGELGYVAADGSVTDDGLRLRRLYAERDLLLAECLRRGRWDGLDAAGLAAVVTTMVFESRRTEGDVSAELSAGVPQEVHRAVSSVQRIWADVDERQRAHDLEPTAAIDTALVLPMYLWAQGRSLKAVLRSTDLAAGDFVRWSKQVLDVLDQ